MPGLLFAEPHRQDFLGYQAFIDAAHELPHHELPQQVILFHIPARLQTLPMSSSVYGLCCADLSHLPCKVVAVQFEAITQISLVRRMPVVARIEMHSVAAPKPGLVLQPTQQSTAPPMTVLRLQGNQVIEI